MPACEWYEDLLPQYVADGEPATRETAALRAHLASCPACADLLARLRRVETPADLPAARLPGPLAARRRWVGQAGSAGQRLGVAALGVGARWCSPSPSCWPGSLRPSNLAPRADSGSPPPPVGRHARQVDLRPVAPTPRPCGSAGVTGGHRQDTDRALGRLRQTDTSHLLRSVGA